MFTGYLRGNESIVKKASVCKAAIAVNWLSVPSIFIIYYLITLPARFKSMIISSVTDAVQDQIGVEKVSFSLDLIPFEIPAAVKVLIAIPIVLLVLAWLIYQCVITAKLLNNHLWLTDQRILGKSDDQTLISDIGEIKNITVEASIWGRFFDYGNLNIVTKSGAITIKSVNEPHEWKRDLMDLVE